MIWWYFNIIKLRQSNRKEVIRFFPSVGKTESRTRRVYLGVIFMLRNEGKLNIYFADTTVITSERR